VVWPYKAGSMIVLHCEFEHEYHKAEDRPCRVTCLGSTCSHRRSLPFQSSQTCSTLTDRNGRETRRRQERCSEAKKTPPWRFGTMMQEMDGIDGDGAVQSTDESDILAGIIALIDGSTYPVFSSDRQTDIRFAKHVASDK
jgi:hypothetical protein